MYSPEIPSPAAPPRRGDISFQSDSSISIDLVSPVSNHVLASSSTPSPIPLALPHLQRLRHSPNLPHQQLAQIEGQLQSPYALQTGGLASARVGLGSPNLGFQTDWSQSPRGGHYPTPDQVLHEPVKRPNGLVDKVSGLPSPPGTNSDIALPPVGEKSLLMESPPMDVPSPPETLTSRLPYILSRPVSEFSSLSTSSLTANGHMIPSQSQGLRPSASTSLSRSVSSSSAHSGPLHASTSSPQPLMADLSREHSLTESSSSQTSRRRSLEYRRASNTSTSRPSRHQHSPSAPIPRSPDKSRLGDRSLTASPIDEEDEGHYRRHERRQSPGIDLDAKILAAEERIRSSGRHPVTSQGLSAAPVNPAIRRHDSSKRMGSPSPLKESNDADFDTLLRSKNSSEGAPIRRSPLPHSQYESLDHHDQQAVSNGREKSGGSSGSGRRKPLEGLFHDRQSASPRTPVMSFASSAGITPRDASSPFTSVTRSRTTSQLSREASEPKKHHSPSLRHFPVSNRADGLERSSTVSSRLERRQWSDSVSGLGRYAEERGGVDSRGLPLPWNTDTRPLRPKSVLETFSRDRPRTREDDLNARMSRLNLTPSDSVSVVGARTDVDSPSTRKNPLDLLKKMEARRSEHNRHWDQERASTVLGDSIARPSPGGRLPESPHYARPTTSMSSLRDDGPRPPSIDRIRRLEQSPVGQNPRLAGSPRHQKSSASLGGRSNVSSTLDINKTSTQHGRILFEACLALESKLPTETRVLLPELVKSLGKTSRSSEEINGAIRAAAESASRLSVNVELEADPARMREEMDGLFLLLRETARVSDQNVRDLTRIMLDLPKLIKGPAPPSSSTSTTFTRPYEANHETRSSVDLIDSPRRLQPRSSPRYALETPVRRSEELFRPVTSTGAYFTPPSTSRRPRDSLPANFVPHANGESKGLSGLVSKIRNNNIITPRKYQTLTDDLATIEASPPVPPLDRDRIPELPISPARRNILRKKPSTTSTHTVRGSGSFLPPSKVVSTTAISAINAGEELSPTVPRSARGSMELDGVEIPNTRASIDSFRRQPFERGISEESKRLSSRPISRLSSQNTAGTYHTASEGQGSSYADDAVSALEQRLVAAQKSREEGEDGDGASLYRRRTSGEADWKSRTVSQRFKDTLRRGSGRD